jgi:hypothetical protein
MKRKPPTKFFGGKYDLWIFEIRHLQAELGLSEDDAWTATILKWMLDGDFRPLAAAIREGRPLSDNVLKALAQMIEEDRLTTKHDGHRPVDPTKFAREKVAALMYDTLTKGCDSSRKEALGDVAAILSMTENTVQTAVTRWRGKSK